MKKLKLNFGEGGLKGWLIRHVEKFVLVLFVGVMVWFVVGGSRLEGIKSGQKPDALRDEALKAVANVRSDRWAAVKDKPERQAESEVATRVDVMMNAKADKSKYPVDKKWDEPLTAKLKSRSDPRILPPFNLKVVTIYGPFALVPDDADVDPLEPIVKEEEDDPKKTKKAPPKKPKKTAGPAGMPGMGGLGGMPGVGGDKGKGKTKGGGPEVPGGLGMGDDGGDQPGMGGMNGMGNQGGPAGKSVDAQIIGWRPPASATIRIQAANVVMAVVPYEKQTTEFDDNLANSLDYDPSRDKPHYAYFAVQRVDVTDDPVADPATFADDVWKGVSVAASLDLMQTWAGTPNDIMDMAYLMPLYKGGKGLTQPLPPFVQRDLYQAMTHPDIPLTAAAIAAPEAPNVRRPKAGDPGDDPDEIPMGGGAAPGGAGGNAGMPGVSGGGPMGMPGKVGGGGAGPGMPGGAAGGPGGMPGGPGGGMGSGGMPGMSDGGHGASGTDALVKYKLVRFIDQNIEKGRKYRYRVKVYLEDPNYPSDTYASPSVAGLDDKAEERVVALEAKDAKSGKAKSIYRTSEFSSASDVSTTPPAEWFYAGSVVPETYQVIDLATNKKYTNFKTQAANALVVVQDDKKGVDVPARWELYKGSAINFTLPAVDVIHPALGEKRKIENYSFQTNGVVADMRGGDEIPLVTGAHTTAFKAPGEILFVDSAGNMHVGDEVEDIEYFHRFIGPAEEPDPKKKKPGEGGGGSDFNGMMPGGGAGIPGGEGIPGGGGGIPGGGPGAKSKR